MIYLNDENLAWTPNSVFAVRSVEYDVFGVPLEINWQPKFKVDYIFKKEITFIQINIHFNTLPNALFQSHAWYSSANNKPINPKVETENKKLSYLRQFHQGSLPNGPFTVQSFKCLSIWSRKPRKV